MLSDVRSRVGSLFTRVARPPGPSALELARRSFDAMQTPIEFMREVQERFGDAAFYRFGPVPIYLFVDPDAVEQVLLKSSRSFIKDALTRDLSELLGEGLLTSEGELWKRQRRLIAPPLQRRHIAHYAAAMLDAAERAADALPTDGGVVDTGQAMMTMTLEIAVRTLFDADLSGAAGQVADAVEVAMEFFQLTSQTWRRFLPAWVPQPGQRRYADAVASLDRILHALIAERRASGAHGDDLLSLLLRARDEDGTGMTDQQLRDEAITMFLAGHETTSLALTWALYVFCHNPGPAARLVEELDTVLGSRRATLEDLARLRYTDAFVKETMRLYPPAWIVGREATEPVQIAGWTIPRGSQVLTPQCVVHRDSRWFPEPDKFHPERWLDGLEKRIPRFAYFPFGGGPRICIGNHFATMEAVLCLATLVQRRRFEAHGPFPGLAPSVTLRPAAPVTLKTHARRHGPAPVAR